MWIVAIWTAVAVGFLVSFFSGGVETFADGSSRVLTCAVFLVCIGLWEAYREPGAVPVGWMWFLAYRTMIFVHLSTAITQLVLDFGNFGDGES